MSLATSTHGSIKTAAHETTLTAGRIADQSHDAIDLLRADNKEIERMFDEYETLDSPVRKRALADNVCSALAAHTAIKEEILYPAVREALDADALLDKASVAHGSAKELIIEIQASQTEDSQLDTRISLLSEYVRHYLQEEQEALFPQVVDSGLDTLALGEEMAQRKQALLAEQQQSD